MKQDIKSKELRERQTYVPASVKVIELTAQRIICTSGGTTEDSQEGSTTGWWD